MSMDSQLLYEGKAKKVYSTEDKDIVRVFYKDDATALNGLKKGTIRGKGAVNNQMSNMLFRMLESHGIETHFVKELNTNETLVKYVKIVPLEVVMRNVACGSLSKRLGWEEGRVLKKPVIEFYYKNDELGDPLINDSHIEALEVASEQDVQTIAQMAVKVNDILRQFMAEIGITLVDFKLEFGRTKDGKIILADEISPDTCRFWDSKTGQRLDKDLFRRDMGGEEDAYQTMFKKVSEVLKK